MNSNHSRASSLFYPATSAHCCTAAIAALLEEERHEPLRWARIHKSCCLRGHTEMKSFKLACFPSSLSLSLSRSLFFFFPLTWTCRWSGYREKGAEITLPFKPWHSWRGYCHRGFRLDANVSSTLSQLDTVWSCYDIFFSLLRQTVSSWKETFHKMPCSICGVIMTTKEIVMLPEQKISCGFCRLHREVCLEAPGHSDSDYSDITMWFCHYRCPARQSSMLHHKKCVTEFDNQL